ncbi:MAG: class I SAM-dependent methyltransferase [Cyanobacteria bacterium P01_A01_bin.137]
MVDRFENVKEMYEESFKRYGDSPASLLTPKGRSELRFRAIDPFVAGRKVRVLDYGCGLGYLYEYLIQAGYEVEYTGVDIVPSFIETCCNKHSNTAKFQLVEPEAEIDGVFDVVFSSGVFNLVTNQDNQISKTYAFRRIKHLFAAASEVLICDFLSPFVDFKQDQAQHFEIDEIASFCSKTLTRRFVLRHDLLPYEFTLLAYQKAGIKRPENFFEVDAKNDSKGATL